jgi:hypothetical protein
MTRIVNSLLPVEADQVSQSRGEGEGGFGGWAVVTLFTEVRTCNLVSTSPSSKPLRMTNALSGY